ncbi:hypothetical protein [Clostridium thermopalmarium]|nr:hypothetical protein [Clostridium thermopalmarium]
MNKANKNEISIKHISQYLFRSFNLKVSHGTIANWTKSLTCT